MKHIYSYIAAGLLAGTMLTTTSCSDWFNIEPENDIILGKFWKKQSDVESAVGACYRGMIEPEFMERIFVWSEVRSDDVIGTRRVNENLSNILKLGLDASNGYTSWKSFYSVINYCNTVIRNAPSVRENDPEFKEGSLRAYLAEAKAVRALCYFYLVRTFKDVPYITEPYVDDTERFEAAQTSGDELLRMVLEDLKTVENDIKSTYSTTAHTKGRITQKGLWTLMADIALWLQDYSTCVAYCDKVLSSSDNPLELEKTSVFTQNVFIKGNSKESIFELQFDNNTPNYVLNEMYRTEGGRDGQNTFQLDGFKKLATQYDANDLRRTDFVIPVTEQQAQIGKYVSYRENPSLTLRFTDYIQGGNASHWIFYRLSDVYLMKAEALVERNEGEGKDLQDALALVNLTFERAHPNATTINDATDGQDNMRKLVMKERWRELCFEGKRYYDLVRKARRDGSVNDVVNTYLIDKYSDNVDMSTAMSKLNELNAFYFPINKDELRYNKLLKQNPFYATSSDISTTN
ncbi:MAG: RagB/SusD family nutrient uptake outer membrane protein [Clostridium sp.]|nr:RagB/SusD family nutrient uptake outer membrane protein [Clostridium sp.]